jgi:hypothetical protein
LEKGVKSLDPDLALRNIQAFNPGYCKELKKYVVSAVHHQQGGWVALPFDLVVGEGPFSPKEGSNDPAALQFLVSVGSAAATAAADWVVESIMRSAFRATAAAAPADDACSNSTEDQTERSCSSTCSSGGTSGAAGMSGTASDCPGSSERFSSIKRMCYNCHRAEEPGVVALKSCMRCRIAVYCGTDCQKEHWSCHKAVCKKDAEAPDHKEIKKESRELMMQAGTLLNFAQGLVGWGDRYVKQQRLLIGCMQVIWGAMLRGEGLEEESGRAEEAEAAEKAEEAEVVKEAEDAEVKEGDACRAGDRG